MNGLAALECGRLRACCGVRESTTVGGSARSVPPERGQTTYRAETARPRNLLETSPVTRPDLWLRHALRPIRPSRPRLPRGSMPRGSMLGTLAVLIAALIAGLAPASPAPVTLGKVSTVAMSRSTLNDRAERHPEYAKRLGHRMTRDFGYKGTHQWHCLRRTWRLESSWGGGAEKPH